MDIEKIIAERNEVEKRLDELDEFRHSTPFAILDRAEQILLNRQSVVMHGLVEILDERIKYRKPTRS